MHSKLRSLFSLCGWAVSLAGGCDDQVAPGYFGESLLTVTGSCEIENSQTRGELVPALGFMNGPAITIVDVPVQGTFPSSFRIEMYEPPPASVFYHPTQQEEGEPLVAVGYITAVTSDHPKKVYTGNSLSATVTLCMDEGRPDKLCLTRTEETCPEPNPDNIACYVEKFYCPMDDPYNRARCVVEKSGDSALKTSDLFDQFAGLSKNYQVIYLSEAAAPGSMTAAWFQSDDGVPAGYGLYEVTDFSSDEAEECPFDDPRVWELATRNYNDAHGTSHKSLNCDIVPDSPFCIWPNEDLEGWERRDEVDRLVEKARAELGCPIGYEHYKRVEDSENTAISIKIEALPSQRASEPPTEP